MHLSELKALHTLKLVEMAGSFRRSKTSSHAQTGVDVRIMKMRARLANRSSVTACSKCCLTASACVARHQLPGLWTTSHARSRCAVSTFAHHDMRIEGEVRQPKTASAFWSRSIA